MIHTTCRNLIRSTNAFKSGKNNSLSDEDIRGSGGTAPPFLTSEIDEGVWSALLHGRFTPGTQQIRGWVGPSAGFDVVEKRKNLPLKALRRGA
jgi:hypothetical protein